MGCAGEHIDGGGFLQLIAAVVEHRDITREGGGIAGHIHHAVGLHSAHGAYGALIHAAARRVDHHRLGAYALL